MSHLSSLVRTLRARRAALSLLVVIASTLFACSGGEDPSGPETPGQIASLEILAVSEVLVVDDVVQLQAMAFDAAGSLLENASVRWSSSDTTVVVVSQSGLATAVRPGPATLRGTVGHISDSVDVSVVASGFATEVTISLGPSVGAAARSRVVAFLTPIDAAAPDAVSSATPLYVPASVESIAMAVGPGDTPLLMSLVGEDASVNIDQHTTALALARLVIPDGGVTPAQEQAIRDAMRARAAFATLAEEISSLAASGNSFTDSPRVAALAVQVAAEALGALRPPTLSVNAARRGSLLEVEVDDGPGTNYTVTNHQLIWISASSKDESSGTDVSQAPVLLPARSLRESPAVKPITLVGQDGRVLVHLGQTRESRRQTLADVALAIVKPLFSKVISNATDRSAEEAVSGIMKDLIMAPLEPALRGETTPPEALKLLAKSIYDNWDPITRRLLLDGYLSKRLSVRAVNVMMKLLKPISLAFTADELINALAYQPMVIADWLLYGASTDQIEVCQSGGVFSACVDRVDISPTQATLPVGTTQTFTATPRDGSGQPVASTVTWTSSDPTTVQLSASTGASVTAKALKASPTPVTITATSGGKSVTAAVTARLALVPLAVGNRWVYELTTAGGQKHQMVWEIIECAATGRCVLRETSGSSQVERAVWNATDGFFLDRTAYYHYKYPAISGEVYFLRFSLCSGTSAPVSATVESTESLVSTPAGEFRAHAYRFTCVDPFWGEQTSRHFVTPGVGVVRLDGFTLQSYTLK